MGDLSATRPPAITSEVMAFMRSQRYRPDMSNPAAELSISAVGGLLRQWRTKRGLSQLDLSLHAGISARHLSYVETGKAQASREMVLRLANALEMPLRERNTLLLAAGYAPAYPERSLATPGL